MEEAIAAHLPRGLRLELKPFGEGYDSTSYCGKLHGGIRTSVLIMTFAKAGGVDEITLFGRRWRVPHDTIPVAAELAAELVRRHEWAVDATTRLRRAGLDAAFLEKKQAIRVRPRHLAYLDRETMSFMLHEVDGRSSQRVATRATVDDVLAIVRRPGELDQGFEDE